MDLVREFESFTRGAVSENPVDEATLTDFLEHLAEQGKLEATEEDWQAFGESRGLSDEQITDLIESAAGWVSSAGDVATEPIVGWDPEDPDPIPVAQSNPRRPGRPRREEEEEVEEDPEEEQEEEEQEEGTEEEEESCAECGCVDQDCTLCDTCGGCECCCKCEEQEG